MDKQNQDKKHGMYIINLDLTRVFWIIATSLFCLTLFFLIGYWLGSSTNYLAIKQDNTPEKERLKKLITNNNITHSYLKEVEQVTNLAEMNYDTLQKKQNNINPQINKPINNKGIKQKPIYSDERLTKENPYAIQVSTYKEKNNAHNTLSSLKKKGFPAYIFTGKNKKGELLYYVRIGPFSLESNTQRVQEKARQLVSLVKESFIISKAHK